MPQHSPPQVAACVEIHTQTHTHTKKNESTNAEWKGAYRSEVTNELTMIHEHGTEISPRPYNLGGEVVLDEQCYGEAMKKSVLPWIYISINLYPWILLHEYPLIEFHG